jgi:Bacteriocin-protection, YdeI or OmpD-Associated/Domain of unknown function (DUF1905)
MPKNSKSGGVTFSTRLAGSGNKTGIEVPPEVIQQLGGGNRPAVSVDVNGYVYRNAVAVMGGKHLIGVSAAIRKETGLQADDPITVTLTIANTPRRVDVPTDFAAALEANPGTRAFFDKLSNSMQRYHVDNIASAKGDETRQRRIDKSVALFREGKQR